MAVSVEVPNLGEAMAGGLVAEWYRADGALVALGEIVCRVESSYIAFEVEAEGEGTLRHQKPAGSIEKPGTVLAMILAADESMPTTREAHGAEAELDDAGWERAPAASELVGGMALEQHAEGEEGALEATVEVEPAEPAIQDSEAEELEEFEEAFREAVVVPFPRRFAEAPARQWEAAPGDAVDFSSALWDGTAEGQAEELLEPGGSIPGLPLWEPEDASAEKILVRPAAERFERIAAAAAGAQVLQAAIVIDVTEAARLATVCEREWPDSPSPAIEDVIFRAIAFAVRENSGADTIGGMLVVEVDADVSSALAAAAAVTFREAVARRHSGGDAAFENASWLLVSVARHGVYSCTPRLEHGRKLAFAMGSADDSGRAALTIAFDSLAWHEGSAARLLARIRELFESPYAMLV